MTQNDQHRDESQHGESPREYYEISLEVPRAIHDAVCNFIVENYTTGIVLADEEDSPVIGIQFYASADEKSDNDYSKNLTAYINDVLKLEEISTASISSSDIRIKKIKNTMWEDKYRQSIKPIIIDNIVVRPPWAEINNPDSVDIIIEPKMAFGTGTHETTKLCLMALAKHVEQGVSVLDLGCGSGILSILSAKLGASYIKGVDIDLIAVDNSRENIVINDVADKIEIEFGSIENAQNDKPYDIVVANIIKSTILELFPRIFESAKENGLIILSGLLVEDREPIEQMLTDYKFNRFEIDQDGEWLVVTVYKS